MKRELKNLRKRNEKHFLNEDGTIEALIYKNDVHYEKDGKYEEINNTLVLKNDRYFNIGNNFDVSFSIESDDKLLEIRKNEHYIKMNMKGSNRVKNKELKKDNIIRNVGSIEYNDIFPNIDVNYQIFPKKLKETIILKDKESIKEKIIFNIETDLKLELVNNKIVSNSDFYIDEPFMIDNNNEQNNLIILYPEILYQSILGFGGAFTESSSYLICQFKEKIQNEFIKDYFSEDGLAYNFARIHINSSDFALETYSYLDNKNKDLSKFDMSRDEKYIIPAINLAQNINSNIQFIASPWSPPAFMKDNNSMYNGGKLLNTYKQLWADYLVKYIQEYEKNNIEINYITVQNEPDTSREWESCNYSAKDETSFIENYLFPTFKFYKLKTKILVWDHNKERIIYRINDMYKNPNISNLINGVAYHYYTGDHFNNLRLLKNLCPELLLIHTEGSTPYAKPNKKDELTNAEIYAHDIIGDLNNGSNAYIDSNLVLDSNGRT